MNAKTPHGNTTGATLANGGNAPTTTNPNASKFIALDVWARQLGRTRSTIHRWRKDGIIREQDLRRLYGKLYITLEGVRYFDALIESGRFAGELHGVAAKSKTPPRADQLRDMAKDNGEDAAEIAADEQFKCGHAATEGAE